MNKDSARVLKVSGQTSTRELEIFNTDIDFSEFDIKTIFEVFLTELRARCTKLESSESENSTDLLWTKIVYSVCLDFHVKHYSMMQTGTRAVSEKLNQFISNNSVYDMLCILVDLVRNTSMHKNYEELFDMCTGTRRIYSKSDREQLRNHSRSRFTSSTNSGGFRLQQETSHPWLNSISNKNTTVSSFKMRNERKITSSF